MLFGLTCEILSYLKQIEIQHSQEAGDAGTELGPVVTGLAKARG